MPLRRWRAAICRSGYRSGIERRLKIAVDPAAVAAFLALERRVDEGTSDAGDVRELEATGWRLLPARLRQELERRVAGRGEDVNSLRHRLTWRSSRFQRTALVRARATLLALGVDASYRGAKVPSVRGRASAVTSVLRSAEALRRGGRPDELVAQVAAALGPAVEEKVRRTRLPLTTAHAVWATLDAPLDAPEALLGRLCEELLFLGVPIDFGEAHPAPGQESPKHDPLARAYKQRLREDFLASRGGGFRLTELDRRLLSGWFAADRPVDVDAEACQAVMLSADPQRCLPLLVEAWARRGGAELASRAVEQTRWLSLVSKQEVLGQSWRWVRRLEHRSNPGPVNPLVAEAALRAS